MSPCVLRMLGIVAMEKQMYVFSIMKFRLSQQQQYNNCLNNKKC